MADQTDLRAKIRAVMEDPNLTEAEKAKKRQEVLCGTWAPKLDPATKENVPGSENKLKRVENGSSLLDDETLKCTICMDLCERPVTAPCQHNFCLKCFQKWVAQTKKTCPTCRASFPASFAQNPRINTALAGAIRLAKAGVKDEAPKTYNRIDNSSRPDEAFTTDRAVRAGRANAASGRIRVTIPNDHFGPILAEHDPERNRGIKVGDSWRDRLDCRQWGAHFPHVAGIAGQSNVGAQSVVLSGGYEDDRDEGEWFLYTGSGGRDLSGNKRTNKVQSFDQEFVNMNKALKESCIKGYPVRVVRSKKEKRSAYAPDENTPVRYDGVYRILRCWRKKGNQGPLICRFLFVRCDNEPAPWSSGESGDEPRMEIPAEAAKEIKQAEGTVYQMRSDPFWDYDSVMKEWVWAKPPPPSQAGSHGTVDPARQARKKVSDQERLLKEFSCGMCKQILVEPLSTPCGHSFCKSCLEKKFEGMADTVENSARTLRVRKVAKPCPKCKTDICDFLSKATVNRDVVAIIQKLQDAAAQAREAAKAAANGDAAAANDCEEDVDDEGAEGEEDSQEEGADQDVDMADQAGPSTSAAATSRPPARQPLAAAPAPAPAPAPVPKVAKGKYADEMAALRAEFPDFDEPLMMGLLEDQGGDLLEVRLYLKKIENQQNRAKASPKGKGKKAADSKAKDAPAEEDSEAPQEQEDDKGAGPSSKRGAKGKKASKAKDVPAEEAKEGPQEQEDDKEAAPTKAKEIAGAPQEQAEELVAEPAAKRGAKGKTAAEAPPPQEQEMPAPAAASGKGAKKAAAKGKAPADAAPEAEAADAPKAAAKAPAAGHKRKADKPEAEEAGVGEDAPEDAPGAAPAASGKAGPSQKRKAAAAKVDDEVEVAAAEVALMETDPLNGAAAPGAAKPSGKAAAAKRKAATGKGSVPEEAAEKVPAPVDEDEDFQPAKKARAAGRASGKGK